VLSGVFCVGLGDRFDAGQINAYPPGRPAAQNGIKSLMDSGFHKPGDVENRLGYCLGQITRD
jgi:hypothetical protein